MIKDQILMFLLFKRKKDQIPNCIENQKISGSDIAFQFDG